MTALIEVTLAAAILAASAQAAVPVAYALSGATATIDTAPATTEPGQRLRLVTASGPVEVERDVEAMQAARPGHLLFVKTSDGEILTARFAGAAP